ncbi:uncharacterized protein LOC118478293 [Aplysia californica]|uniref:Uncharacterized protein LOC118478293 n=1 Tax=Aplysia californica TaxID=6500 RepID=A0ABM1VYM9_APLCA|nr:uncharacterized protein LOC118478293 [Aplysia californica]
MDKKQFNSKPPLGPIRRRSVSAEQSSSTDNERKPVNLRGRAMRNDKECEGCNDLSMSRTDPIHFLPTMPMKRARPVWMVHQPSFVMSGLGEMPPDKLTPLDLWYNTGARTRANSLEFGTLVEFNDFFFSNKLELF